MGTKIISVANRKGGVGKSTVTMLLAAALAKQHGRRVLVLDADEQRTINDTADIIDAGLYPDMLPLYDVRAVTAGNIFDVIRAEAAGYDIVFIDPPRVTEDKTDGVLGQLMTACDLVLVPALGSQIDMLSTLNFVMLLKKIAKIKTSAGFGFEFAGFINRSSARSENRMAAEYLADTGLPMLEANLSDLKIFGSPSTRADVGGKKFSPFLAEVVKRFKL
jgi:chromosome partitioning protein